jgi:hypothetical protein
MEPNPFPSDNRLREDIGLLPLADSRPPLQLPVRAVRYFPTDDRLRDDVGLPPIGEGLDVDGTARSMASRSLSATRQRLIAAGSRAFDGFATAVAAILGPRRNTRIVP